MSNELKSLTLNGTKYNSFVDQTARGNGGGGTGGGGANIDVVATVGQTIRVKEVDANGKPTKWEAAEYQEKICDESWSELIPLTEFTPFYYEPMSVPMQQLIDVDFVPGQTYKVIFDGVEYICEADTYYVSGMLMNAIGNEIFAGGENTGEPFALFRVRGDTKAAVITFDMNSHSVQVIGKATPIELKYLTNAFPYYIDVVEHASGTSGVSSTFECFETVENVMKIFNSGRPLALRIAMINGGQYRYDAYAQLVIYGSNNGHHLWAFAYGTNFYGMTDKDDGTVEIANID